MGRCACGVRQIVQGQCVGRGRCVLGIRRVLDVLCAQGLSAGRGRAAQAHLFVPLFPGAGGVVAAALLKAPCGPAVLDGVAGLAGIVGLRFEFGHPEIAAVVAGRIPGQTLQFAVGQYIALVHITEAIGATFAVQPQRGAVIAVLHDEALGAGALLHHRTSGSPQLAGVQVAGQVGIVWALACIIVNAEFFIGDLFLQPVQFLLAVDGQQRGTALRRFGFGLFPGEPSVQNDLVGPVLAVLAGGGVHHDPGIATVFPGADTAHLEEAQCLRCRAVGIGGQPGDGVGDHVGVRFAAVLQVAGHGVFVDVDAVGDVVAVIAQEGLSAGVQGFEGDRAAIALAGIPDQFGKICRGDDVVAFIRIHRGQRTVFTLHVQRRAGAVEQVGGLRFDDADGCRRPVFLAADDLGQVVLAQCDQLLERGGHRIGFLFIDRR